MERNDFFVDSVGPSSTMGQDCLNVSGSSHECRVRLSSFDVSRSSNAPISGSLDSKNSGMGTDLYHVGGESDYFGSSIPRPKSYSDTSDDSTSNQKPLSPTSATRRHFFNLGLRRSTSLESLDEIGGTSSREGLSSSDCPSGCNTPSPKSLRCRRSISGDEYSTSTTKVKHLGKGLRRRTSTEAVRVDIDEEATIDTLRRLGDEDSFIFPVSAIPEKYSRRTICPDNLSFQNSLSHLKHICDGSHSHIYKGLVRMDVIDEEIVTIVRGSQNKKSSMPSPKLSSMFSCVGTASSSDAVATHNHNHNNNNNNNNNNSNNNSNNSSAAADSSSNESSNQKTHDSNNNNNNNNTNNKTNTSMPIKNNNNGNKTVDRRLSLKPIEGTFGGSQVGGLSVVVKRISNKSTAIERARQDFELERDILRRLQHPNIVIILGSGYDDDEESHISISTKATPNQAAQPRGSLNMNDIIGPTTEAEATTAEATATAATTATLTATATEKKNTPTSTHFPFLVLERLDGGSLAYILEKPRPFYSTPFKPDRLLSLACQFADALAYMHTDFSPMATLIHRDLKPDNIGFTVDGTLKLMDFGLCISIKKSNEPYKAYKMTGTTGSLRYMAPEVIRNEPYSEMVDIYSFSLILYEMATGVTPYGGGITKNDFIKSVAFKHDRPPLDLDDYGRRIKCCKGFSDLISNGWHPNPAKRPRATECLRQLRALASEAAATPRGLLGLGVLGL